MVLCGFIFDIIIVRIDAPNNEFEDPCLVTVDAVFNNVALKITSSRINVVEFRSGRSYEFDAVPDELKTEMQNFPLQLSVNYNGQLVGSACLEWPDSVLNRISDCVGELTHMDECELMKDDVRVGSVEIIIRLQTKCQEIEDDGPVKTCEDIRKQLDKVINPHDILFIVGEANKRNDECAGLVPSVSQISNEAHHTTALDLSRYRSVNGRLVQTPDILNTCGNDECCELKKMSNTYQKLIDTLMGCDRPPERRSCRASSHTRECPHDNKFSESSATAESSAECKFPCACYAAQHNHGDNHGAFAGEKLINICPRDSAPELPQKTFVENRRCPVCKENVSWLPKLAACPKCGYKPVPVVEERPYNTQMTADQILAEYLEKHTSSTDRPESNKEGCCDEKKECRCTCKYGKVCAHCRIRKLCEDIFQTKAGNTGESPTDDCGKCETKSSQDIYNVCKSSSKDCRPYLARVFSELRELYNIKETKRKAYETNPRCEKMLHSDGKNKESPTRGRSKSREKPTQGRQQSVSENRSKPKKRKDGENVNTERKLYLKKNYKKSSANCKRKPYNYRTVRKYPGTQIGHKTCVNGFAAGRKNVPANMGWLWNVDTVGVRRGWKPGAIRKPIKCLMKYFLKDFPADTLRVSQYHYRKEGKGDNTETEELVQKPTLHICKKNDEYFITLRPLKDAEALRQCADPYLNMKPIQFKIVKNPLVVEMRKLKRYLKDMGFAKCTCHKPVVDCFCRSFLDKKRLEYQVNKECRKRSIPCCNQTLVLSDTTDSDVEFDFGVTPPAGVIKPERLKKPNLVNHGTQYVQGDWNVVPVFPKPPNKYMKMYNCATGERFGPGGRYGGVGGGGGWGGDGSGPGGRGGGRGGRGGGRGGPGGAGGGRGGAFGPGGRGGARGGRGGGVGADGRMGGGAAGGPGGTGGPGGAGGGPGGKGGKGPNMYFGEKGGGAGGKGGAGGGAGGAGGPGALTEKQKRRRALGEIPPPLLCMVDRRGKPCDPCNPCNPCNVCCDDYCCMPRNYRIC